MCALYLAAVADPHANLSAQQNQAQQLALHCIALLRSPLLADCAILGQRKSDAVVLVKAALATSSPTVTECSHSGKWFARSAAQLKPASCTSCSLA